jgi:hypothetical protein
MIPFCYGIRFPRPLELCCSRVSLAVQLQDFVRSRPTRTRTVHMYRIDFEFGRNLRPSYQLALPPVNYSMCLALM